MDEKNEKSLKERIPEEILSGLKILINNHHHDHLLRFGLIQKNLSMSVKLFSYWARKVKQFIKLEKKLKDKQELIKEKRQTREAKQKEIQETHISELAKEIEKFNQNNKKQSKPIKAFFKELKKRKEEKGKKRKEADDLTVDDFKDLTDDTINEIRNEIRKVVVKEESKNETQNETQNETKTPRDSSRVSLSCFNTNINWLIEIIENVRVSINPDVIKTEIQSIEKEIKKINQLENIDDDEESDNNDSTNFAVSEMGFLIEVQSGNNDPHTEYYHYPVTFPNKNTFSIYDLCKEEFNYFSVKNKKLYHGNYIVDDYIMKHTTEKGRSQADPSNDYHSETVLFLLCQQRSFQEKMINKLIRDLQEKKLKLIMLKSLILHIHSTNDICTECFKKAGYLFNWKVENTKSTKKNKKERERTREKKTNNFLECFRVVFSQMLEKNEVLDQNAVLDEKGVLEGEIEGKIIFSYDKVYDKKSKKSHPNLFRDKSNNIKIKYKNKTKLNFTLLLYYSRTLSKYSIIISGGVANDNKDYCCAYNKVAEPMRKYAVLIMEKYRYEKLLKNKLGLYIILCLYIIMLYSL